MLVGDIGGTHARLSLIRPNGRAVLKKEFASRMYPSLEAVLREFLDSATPKPRLSAAAFGVAGPVVGGRVVATNLPWVIDSRIIGRKLGIKRVKRSEIHVPFHGQIQRRFLKQTDGTRGFKIGILREQVNAIEL